jgi:hypothetical protein
MSTIAAAVLTADRIDNWIRRQVMQYWLQHDATDFAPRELWPAQPQTTTASSPSSTRVSAPRRSRSNRLSQSKAVLAWDSSVWLSALGQCLKAQYDALAALIPPQVAALVEQLETQK